MRTVVRAHLYRILKDLTMDDFLDNNRGELITRWTNTDANQCEKRARRQRQIRVLEVGCRDEESLFG